MAKKYRHRRKRGLSPLGVFLIVAALVAIVVVGIIVIVKVSPNKTLTDLKYYYNLKINAMSGRDAASESELAIVLDGKIFEERAFKETNGQVYINRSIVLNYIDERFYYDDNESILIITNATQTIIAGAQQSGYTIDGTPVETEYVPVISQNGNIYVAMDFVDEFSNATYTVYGEYGNDENPPRLVIRAHTGETSFCDAKTNTWIRALEENDEGLSVVTKKSEVVGTVEKGSKLMIVGSAVGDWYKVVSDEGWVGYIDSGDVSEQYKENVAGDYEEPEYTSLSIGTTVKLGWGGVYSMAANDNYYSYTRGTDINVYSPTWYFLSGGDGSITMYSDSEYVDEAHSDGYLVWALFSDEDYEFAEQSLTRTSVRNQMEDALISDMLTEGIDGINIDFERIDSDYGEDFIQFIREMSIRCRQEGLYLSVDNYTPYEYNACYHIQEQAKLCDYVILMAYDDYLGSGSAGPNSSLPFVQSAIELSLEKVSAEKLVVAIPFYSRVWSTNESGELSRVEYAMTNAWTLMNQMGCDPTWDEANGVYYAEYDYGSKHSQAWLENADSISAKLNLIKGYNVAGVAFWQLDQETDDIWDVVATY